MTAVLNFCDVCAYADEHGSWSTILGAKTHCRDCHATWGGKSRGHCTRCHETFSSDSASREHWTKHGHCHPTTVAALEFGDDGVWHLSGESPHAISALASDRTAAQTVGRYHDGR